MPRRSTYPLDREMEQRRRDRLASDGVVYSFFYIDGLTQLQRPQIDWVHLARGDAVDTAEDLARELADAIDADGPRVIVANI